MKLRQLFDHNTSTYSYLVWDESTREAALIDSVREQLERDTHLINELGLKLKYALETHVHADHITASGLLRDRLGCKVGVHTQVGSDCPDIKLSDDDRIHLGELALEVLYTPGHTDTDICYLAEGMVFTGDILLIHGSGRTDFQSGDAGRSYDSITNRLFTLPEETLVYPGHDYNGFTCSTIGEEKCFNPRLGGNRSREEYIQIMQNMKLEKPRMIEQAVPGNQACGLVRQG